MCVPTCHSFSCTHICYFGDNHPNRHPNTADSHSDPHLHPHFDIHTNLDPNGYGKHYSSPGSLWSQVVPD